MAHRLRRMIEGIGVDAVPVARMRRALERTPRVRERLFTNHERETAEGRGVPAQSYAARFAAKEACRKALRTAVGWHDIEVRSAPDGVPSLSVAGRSDLRFHVSLTHTDDVAVAVVVAERSG